MSNTAKKRISVELVGDDAILADILTTSLRIGEMSKSKAERDQVLVSLALKALSMSIEDYREEFGVKYPNSQQMSDYLANE